MTITLEDMTFKELKMVEMVGGKIAEVEREQMKKQENELKAKSKGW